ncbi:MAG TPA: hypothetical protein VFZ70_17555 [Euzebyales bacterium]
MMFAALISGLRREDAESMLRAGLRGGCRAGGRGPFERLTVWGGRPSPTAT